MCVYVCVCVRACVRAVRAVRVHFVFFYQGKFPWNSHLSNVTHTHTDTSRGRRTRHMLSDRCLVERRCCGRNSNRTPALVLVPVTYITYTRTRARARTHTHTHTCMHACTHMQQERQSHTSPLSCVCAWRTCACAPLGACMHACARAQRSVHSHSAAHARPTPQRGTQTHTSCPHPPKHKHPDRHT